MPEINLSQPGYVDDDELCKALRIPTRQWPLTRARLENEGLPKPDPVIGRYYGPAIVAFLERRHKMQTAQPVPALPDGGEVWS